MEITPMGVAITERFFEAVALLKEEKSIRGLQTLTNRYGWNRWNTQTLRNDPAGHVLKPEMMAALVRDYGVSADWLLLGAGEWKKKGLK
jgi:hypothetical protein